MQSMKPIKDDKVYLYGKHALREALLAKPASVQKVFLDANAEAVNEVLNETKKIDFKSLILSSAQDGFTALVLAARSGRAEVVQLLLSAGADINHKSKVS